MTLNLQYEQSHSLHKHNEQPKKDVIKGHQNQKLKQEMKPLQQKEQGQKQDHLYSKN